MEPVQAQPATPTATPTNSTGIFGTKIPASAAFLVALLLFLLPFVEIKCNGTPIASNTGLGIALGTEPKELVSQGMFGNGLGANSSETFDQKPHKQDANMFAIAALGLGVVGLLIAFLAPKGGGMANTVIAALAAISLVAMLVDLKGKVKSDNSLKPSSDLNFDPGVHVSVDGTGAFYFAIILFLLAAFFSWQRGNSANAK